MANVVGTHDISTLLAARFQSPAAFGLSTIESVLAADIAAHNAIVQNMVGEIAEVTTDRQRIYGTSADGDMIEVDEFGRAPTQKSAPGATVGFPMRLFQFNLGWTDKFMKTATTADLAIKMQAAQKAHLRAIQREMKRAIYGSANYTWTDMLVDNVSLGVKRFVNADSAAIPNGPNGEAYDGTSHTHYTANATLTAAALLACVNNVIEHGFGGAVHLIINKTDEAAVRALSGFVAYPDPRIVYRVTDTPGATLDISRLDNRAIGIFNGSEVWVKPWAIANYALAYDAGASGKPLAFRQRDQTALQGLRIASQFDSYPLYAQFMEAEYGMGVWTRTNGAVLYFAGVSYTDPVIS